MKNLTSALTVMGGALIASTAFAQDLPPCEAGMHLERAGTLNYPGTILEVDSSKGSYKLRMDDGELLWVDASGVQYSCAALRGGAQSTDFYTGRWDLFMGPAPQYETRGDDVYLVVGSGAGALPVTINADGTYHWETFDGPIDGYWEAIPAGQDKYGYGTPAILLRAGEEGEDWQMWSQGGISRDNREQVTLEQLNYGISYLATRED